MIRLLAVLIISYCIPAGVVLALGGGDALGGGAAALAGFAGCIVGVVILMDWITRP